jgi:ribosomal protein S18
MLGALLRHRAAAQIASLHAAVAPAALAGAAAPAPQAAAGALLSLRRFSERAEGAAGGADAPASAEAEAGAAAPAAGAAGAAGAPAQQQATLQNAKIWQSWVRGKLDERPAGAPDLGGAPHEGRIGRVRPTWAARAAGGVAPAPGGGGGSGAGAGGAAPRGPPSRGPAGSAPRGPGGGPPRGNGGGDWKAAARSSERAAERRIGAIVAGADDAAGAPRPGGGRYGWLGGADDAPRVAAGASARAEELSPARLHPHRLFFPGQSYSPEDLDPYKAKGVAFPSDLNAASRQRPVPAAAAAAGVDFRNVALLALAVSEAGKLAPRRRTRLPARAHRELSRAVKLARALALLHPCAAPPRPGRFGARRRDAGGAGAAAAAPQPRGPPGARGAEPARRQRA